MHEEIAQGLTTAALRQQVQDLLRSHAESGPDVVQSFRQEAARRARTLACGLNAANATLNLTASMDPASALDCHKQNGGLVKISNFFPSFVANGILSVLEAISPRHWNVTEAARDHASNNIAHKFWSSKTAPGLESIVRAISVLQPGRLNTFSAGKYEKSNHIEPHDDRAYADVYLEGNTKVKCSRDIAVIYYLTKDWTSAHGGTLIDIPTGKPCS